MLDGAKQKRFVDQFWGDAIVPTLVDYIRIPNKSPAFDPDWSAHGYMEDAVQLFAGWVRDRLGLFPGARLDIVRLPGRTPLLLIEVPGNAGPGGLSRAGDTVLLYGHLDKQPEMDDWDEGYGPWLPRLKDDKLYGRGGADDGYAMFSALAALAALREQAVPHANCVVLIEACEESGSCDLPHYIDHLTAHIGSPSLVVCLDSGCGNYDQLWVTTSLRGIAAGTLKIDVLEKGVHSGDASGIVPGSFRILRQLLSRIEDEATGTIRPGSLLAEIPAERIEQAKRAAEALGGNVYTKFPFAAGTRPMTNDLTELVLNRTWRPQLAVIGIEGLPKPGAAGNVLLPRTTAQLSLRLPPTVDAAAATVAIQTLLEADPPYGSRVSFTPETPDAGWNAPAEKKWLTQSLARTSQEVFGAPPAYMGEGGSIPFMAMLGEKFPEAQFVVTGVLGPHSNAHGPNEFLHLPTGRRVTEAIARVLADHWAEGRGPFVA